MLQASNIFQRRRDMPQRGARDFLPTASALAPPAAPAPNVAPRTTDVASKSAVDRTLAPRPAVLSVNTATGYSMVAPATQRPYSAAKGKLTGYDKNSMDASERTFDSGEAIDATRLAPAAKRGKATPRHASLKECKSRTYASSSPVACPSNVMQQRRSTLLRTPAAKKHVGAQNTASEAVSLGGARAFTSRATQLLGDEDPWAGWDKKEADEAEQEQDVESLWRLGYDGVGDNPPAAGKASSPEATAKALSEREGANVSSSQCNSFHRRSCPVTAAARPVVIYIARVPIRSGRGYILRCKPCVYLAL